MDEDVALAVWVGRLPALLAAIPQDASPLPLTRVRCCLSSIRILRNLAGCLCPATCQDVQRRLNLFDIRRLHMRPCK